MPYRTVSKELKERAVEMYIDGRSAKEISAELGCSKGSVFNWVAREGFEVRDRKGKAIVPKPQPLAVAKVDINPLLVNLAQGNDLTPFIGKEICKMQPREIFKFLELLNIKGELKLEQRVKLK